MNRVCEKNLDKEIHMGYKSHMDIGKVLRELIGKEGRSFRQTSIDLKVDRSTLHRSLKKGNPEWKTIEKVLNYLGYEFRVVKSAKYTKPKRRSYDSRNRKSN
jgi:lambda repressor-like predicted transcriptional regulator